MRTKQDKDTAKPRVVLERTELAKLEASFHGTVTLPKQSASREGGSHESGSRETVAKESVARESAAKDGTSAEGATKEREQVDRGSQESGPKDSRPKDGAAKEEAGEDEAARLRELEESGSRDSRLTETSPWDCRTTSSDPEDGTVSAPPGRSTDNSGKEPSSSVAAALPDEKPPVVDSVMDIINLVAGGYGGEAHLGNGDVGSDETPSPRDSEASPGRSRLSSETSKKLPPKKRRKKEDKSKSTGDAAEENRTSVIKSSSLSERLEGSAVTEQSSATSESPITARSPTEGAFRFEEPKPKAKKSSKKRKLEGEADDIHNGMNKAAKKPSKKKKNVADVVDGECNHVDITKTNIAPGAKKTKSSGKQKAAPPRTSFSQGDQTSASDGGQGVSQGGSVKTEPVETVVTCASASEAEAATTGAQAQEVKAKPKKKKSKALQDSSATENPEALAAPQDEAMKKKKKSKKKSKASAEAGEVSVPRDDSSGVGEGAEKMDTTDRKDGIASAEAEITKKKKPKASKKKPAVVKENGVTTSEGEPTTEVKPKKPAKPRKRKSDAAKVGKDEGEESEKTKSPSKKIKLEPKENGAEVEESEKTKSPSKKVKLEPKEDGAEGEESEKTKSPSKKIKHESKEDDAEPSRKPKPKKKSRPKKKSTAEASTSSTEGSKAAAPSPGEGSSHVAVSNEADAVASIGESGEVKMEEETTKTDGEEKKKGEKKPKKQLDPVKCEDCGRECRGLSSLSRHMKQVHQKVLNPTKFHCERCEFTAPKRILLAAHLEIHGIYLCHRCGYRSENKDLVVEHKRTKHQAKEEVKEEGEKPITNPPSPKFHCEHCDFTAFKRTAFAAHLETHDVFLCHRCGYRTEDKDLLEEHINTKHMQREDVKLCRKCNRYVKGDQLPLEKHLGECLGPIPFACTECDRQFKYESLLKIHLHSHFPDQPKLHKCPHCDYTSNYKANLSNHIGNLHVKRERHVKCPKCDKMFYNQGNMRRHLKLHTDERLYKCDKCDKAFRSRHSLRGHSTVHNPVTLKCAFDGCDKEFRSAKYYRIHKVEKHQNVPKKFACPFENCNFSFFKRSHLKRHEITHTGERNYHCPYPGCGKSFRHADNLKVHQRQHTNEKPVRCEFCDCAFRQRSSLHWHKKKFHGIGAKSGATQKPSSSSKSCSTAGTSTKTPAFASKDANETGASGSGEQSSSTEQDEGLNLKKEAVPSLDKADEDTSSSMLHLMESKPFDMYEFMSDDEGEKSPVVFRRDMETYTPGIPPLPPPPESLLLKEAAKAEKKKKKSKKKKKNGESQVQSGEPSEEGAESSSVQVKDAANASTSESSKTPKEKVAKKSKAKGKTPKTKAAKEKTAKSPKKAKESKKKAYKKATSSKDSKKAKAQKDDKTDEKEEGEGEEEGQSSSETEEQIKPVTTRKKAAAQKKALQKKSPAKKTVAKKKAVKSPAIKSKKSPVKKSPRLARGAKKTPSAPQSKAVSKKKKAPVKKKASKSPRKSPAKKSPPKESRSKRRSAASIEAVEEEDIDKNEEENVDEAVAERVKANTKKAVVVGGKQAATLTPPDSLPDEEEERRGVPSPLDDPDVDEEDDNGNCDNDRDEEEAQPDDRSRSPSPAVEEHVEENLCALSDDGMGREELQENKGDQDERQDEDMGQEDLDNMDGEGDEERQGERQEDEYDYEDDHTMMSSDGEMSNDIPLTPPRAPAPPPPQSPEYDEEEDLNPPEPPPSSPPQQTMMHSVGSEVHQAHSVEQLGSIGSNPEPCTPQSQPPPPPQPTPPTPVQYQPNPTSEADKDFLGQYLQQLNLPEGGRDMNSDDANRLQRLEELAEKPHESSSGEGSMHSSSMEYTKSVITTNPNMIPLPAHAHDMSNRRMQILASDRQVEQHYLRDTPSTLPPPARLPDPLREAPVPYEGFPTLNPLSLGSRDNNLLRSNENLFTAPTTGGGFMRLSESDAMLQRQRMTTPFLAQNDRTALPRIPETSLRPTNPALIRRPGTMPREEMFTAPTMPQAMPRNPFTSTWSGQEVRPAHWPQNPYLQPRPIDRQPNATATPFFPKDNYLTGREFVFDPTCRMTDRNMFASLSSPQPQRELAPETFQLDRFDLSSYFSNYSGTASLDYSRSACGTAPKAFDERYRTPTATMGEFRGLPQSSTTDMFSTIGVNSGFPLDKYVRDTPYPMYHPQMPGDTSGNSAFLTHPTPGQPPSVFDREYPHRSLYPQNTPYPFIDERQYPTAAKLSHPTAPAMTSQERDFMTRTNPAENQMQDPYRCSMLYMNRYPFDSV